MKFIKSGAKPLVFYSIISPDVKRIINSSEGFCQDIVQSLVLPLEKEIGVQALPQLNKTHGLTEKISANMMLELLLLNTLLSHDDGISLRNLDQAQSDLNRCLTLR